MAHINSSGLHEPLQTYMLPHLSPWALGLASTCKRMQQLVERAPVEIWRAVAAKGLPPQPLLHTYDRQAVRQRLQEYGLAKRNVYAGRYSLEARDPGNSGKILRRCTWPYASLSPDGGCMLWVTTESELCVHQVASGQTIRAVVPEKLQDANSSFDPVDCGWDADGQHVRIAYLVHKAEVGGSISVRCRTYCAHQNELVPATCTTTPLEGTRWERLVFGPACQQVWCQDGYGNLECMCICVLSGNVLSWQALSGSIPAWSQDGVCVAEQRNADGFTV